MDEKRIVYNFEVLVFYRTNEPDYLTEIGEYFDRPDGVRALLSKSLNNDGKVVLSPDNLVPLSGIFRRLRDFNPPEVLSYEALQRVFVDLCVGSRKEKFNPFDRSLRPTKRCASLDQYESQRDPEGRNFHYFGIYVPQDHEDFSRVRF